MSTNITSTNTIAEVPYVPLGCTETMSNSPRFGHSSDFSVLFSSNSADVKDYTRGLVFAGAFVLAIFITWSLVLLAFKFMGPNKVGFLSGNPFTIPGYYEPRKFKRPLRVRMSVVAAGITLIIFSILVVTKGLSNYQETVTTFSNSNDEIHSLLLFAQDIANSLQSLGLSTITVRDELVADLGDFCPAGGNITRLTGFDFDAMAHSAIDLLNQLGNFIFDNVAAVQTGIDSSLQTSADIDRQLSKVDINDWQSLIIIIPFVVLTSFLLVGLMMSTYRISPPWFTCLISWFFIPFFAVMVTLAYVASSLTALASVSNADFCSGGVEQSPDQTVRDILRTRGFSTNDIVSKSVYFYISQCQTPDPWLFLNNYTSQIDVAETTVTDLNKAIKAVSIDGLTFLCGKNFTAYEVLLNTMETNLGILRKDAASVLDLLSCDRIVPIYTRTVYDGTCTYSISGLTWTFASFFIIAFMGMLMLTFRAAFYEVIDENRDVQGNLVQNNQASNRVKGNTTSLEEDSFQETSHNYDASDMGEPTREQLHERDHAYNPMNGNITSFEDDSFHESHNYDASDIGDKYFSEDDARRNRRNGSSLYNDEHSDEYKFQGKSYR